MIPRGHLSTRAGSDCLNTAWSFESRQNDPMKKLRLIPSLLLLLAAAPLQAETWVPWPTKEQLRKIQLEAYSCSRENIEAPCSNSRELADALMDHPRLPGNCKDILWEIIETSKVAPRNDYKRRDQIDQPARRLTTLCAEPVKKQDKPRRPQGPGASAQS